jgi:hypothetical protein
VSGRVGAAYDFVTPIAPQFIYPCCVVDALAGILKHPAVVATPIVHLWDYEDL